MLYAFGELVFWGEPGHYTIGAMTPSEERPQELLSVGTVNSQAVAEIIKSLLNAHGIDVWLSQESAGSAIGLAMGPMAQVEIIVRAEQVEQARPLLGDGLQTDPDS